MRPVAVSRTTIYLGSAPTTSAANRGLEDRRIRLGCVMPGESPTVFGDALRRLAAAATYLYQDGPRYWYSTQPTVTKLAEDRAEQLRRDSDKVVQELDRRLRLDLRKMGDFNRVHPCPFSAPTCPTTSMRLVVLGSDHPYTREAIARPKWRPRRSWPGAATCLASSKTPWSSSRPIKRGCKTWTKRYAVTWPGNPFWPKRTPSTSRPTRSSRPRSRGWPPTAPSPRLPETYLWLLAPTQATPQSAVTWQATRLSGPDALAVRASRKLRHEAAGHCIGRLAPAHGTGSCAAVAPESRRDSPAGG
ncbi:MAG: hypothetical protein HZY76_04290 [Anaerolineae bacterium]|nr:MAG: hypothetical protein HZY76_04290 [Anaerolineae bacterium]